MARRLEGKIAIITGGASGIGAATARLFVEHGAIVIIADIQDELGIMLALQLGDNAEYKHCDVTISDHNDNSEEKYAEGSVAAVIQETVRKHGRLDIMMCNAGAAFVRDSQSPFWALDMDVFDRTMSLNVRGVVLGVKHASRAMIKTRSAAAEGGAGPGGCILCTSSVVSVLAQGGGHSYCISKQAVVAIVRSAASELGAHGIRVNAISPHVIETPLTTGIFAQLKPTLNFSQALEACSPLHGTWGTVDDIARAALYLASDDGRFISGHNLVIDGGFSICKGIELRNPPLV